jgi:DNA-binding Xre family transcriptional regulator
MKNNENNSSLKKRWLSPNDLEKEYGFSKSTQAKMRMSTNSSNIPFSKIGGYVRYDRILVDKWLSEHQVKGA